MTNDRRLIEDYLPVNSIGKAGSSEPRTKGHISTLHVWRARRPLVACRAAIYGALVPASLFVLENGHDNNKQSIVRENTAKFVTELCKYPGNPNTIKPRNISSMHKPFGLSKKSRNHGTSDEIDFDKGFPMIPESVLEKTREEAFVVPIPGVSVGIGAI